MRLGFLLTVMVVASGCASADHVPTTAEMRSVDEAKMQQIEEAAARRGVRVYWVNPPQKPTSAAGG